ncbi:hypothetical protein FOMPIDRAFT_99331, partial [Fomitopsis schrenkii]
MLIARWRCPSPQARAFESRLPASVSSSSPIAHTCAPRVCGLTEVSSDAQQSLQHHPWLSRVKRAIPCPTVPAQRPSGLHETLRPQTLWNQANLDGQSSPPHPRINCISTADYMHPYQPSAPLRQTQSRWSACWARVAR